MSTSTKSLAVGASESEAVWLEFCRSVARGLRGVQLVISDAQEGLRSALAQVFTGATWQRCKVHFLATWPALSPSCTRRRSSRW